MKLHLQQVIISYNKFTCIEDEKRYQIFKLAHAKMISRVHFKIYIPLDMSTNRSHTSHAQLCISNGKCDLESAFLTKNLLQKQKVPSTPRALL